MTKTQKLTTLKAKAKTLKDTLATLQVTMTEIFDSMAQDARNIGDEAYSLEPENAFNFDFPEGAVFEVDDVAGIAQGLVESADHVQKLATKYADLHQELEDLQEKIEDLQYA